MLVSSDYVLRTGLFLVEDYLRYKNTHKNRNPKKPKIAKETQQRTEDAGPTTNHQNPIYPSPGQWPGDVHGIPTSTVHQSSAAESFALSTRPRQAGTPPAIKISQGNHQLSRHSIRQTIVTRRHLSGGTSEGCQDTPPLGETPRGGHQLSR